MASPATSDLWAFTSQTVFPSLHDGPATHIELRDKAFKIMDRLVNEPEASEEFRNISTKGGMWKTPFATYTGHDELSKSCISWNALRQRNSMRHWVKKIYINDARAEDLMIFGRIRVGGIDQEVRDLSYFARVVITVMDDKDATRRLKFFQGWSSPQ